MMGWPRPQRWDPIGELQREFGRLLQTLEPLPGWRSPRPFPAINLYDSGDRFLLLAEVPGMSASEIEISLTGDRLILGGERRRSEGVSDESYRRQERQFGRWSRSVTLPEHIDGSGVSAQCDHGLLTIILPKASESLPRQISVSSSTP